MNEQKSLALAQTAALLADFVDVMLPGAAGWPAGSALGVQYPLVGRLVEQFGAGATLRLVTALLAAGGPFDGLDTSAQASVVAAFEAAEPVFFGQVRDTLFHAYYEHPIVVAIIDASGRPYRLRPHLEGYVLPKFDIDQDKPRHNRGVYVATGAVVPLPGVAQLELDTRITTVWGVNR